MFVLALTAKVVIGTVPKLTAIVFVRNVSQVFSGNLKALIFKPWELLKMHVKVREEPFPKL